MTSLGHSQAPEVAGLDTLTSVQVKDKHTAGHRVCGGEHVLVVFISVSSVTDMLIISHVFVDRQVFLGEAVNLPDLCKQTARL